jgi:hypothetical protein
MDSTKKETILSTENGLQVQRKYISQVISMDGIDGKIV